MTSNDNEILVAIHENQVYLLNELQGVKAEQQAMNKRLNGIESRLGAVETEQQAIRAELQTVHEEQRVLAARADTLQTSVYWVFGAITIFLTAIALWPSRREQPVQSVQSERRETKEPPLIIQVPAYYPDPEIWVRKNQSQQQKE